MNRREKILIVLGILFISFNLRAPITAVGSIVEMIQTDYSLSNAVAGFITTLPLIAFAAVSPFVAYISARLGQDHTMMIGLLFILAGEIVRSYMGVIGLFAGTVLLGIGIAIGNVVIPGIIKMHFSHRVGLVTSVYTSGMCIFAAVGAGISVPLARGLDLGWNNSLASWFILTLVTVLIWLYQVRKPETKIKHFHKEHSRTSIWTSPLAWWVTLFMGTQSLLFYSLVAWLPTIVVSKGMSAGYAGAMALTYQLMAIPATLLMPVICDRFHHQRVMVLIDCFIYGTGMILFLIAHTKAVMALAVIFMALGMGGSISLSIAFISLRSPNALKASELSGMSQSAGYLFAAVGPVLTGLIFDIKCNWDIPICIFAGLVVLLAFTGMFAGSHKTVKE